MNPPAKKPDPYQLRCAIQEAHGHPVFTLKCGAFGTGATLYRQAISIGYDGTEASFRRRLHSSGGKKTLAELSKPAKKQPAKKKDKSDVLEAIRALDARKSAIARNG